MINKLLVTKSIESLVEGHGCLDHLCLMAGIMQIGMETDYDKAEKMAEEMFDEYEEALAEEADSGHFKCETCSWWFEHHEASEDEEGSCRDCDD